MSKRNEYYRVGNILHTQNDQLNIRVTEHQITRALCIMDAVVKFLQKRGHNFKFKNSLSYIVIGHEEIEVSLRETSIAITSSDKWQSRTLQPNGKLELKFNHYSHSTTGKDGKVPLEEQISKIIARLELMADELRVQTEENRIWRLQHEEKERLRKEKAERKKLELATFKKTLQDASRWQEVIILREYIDVVETTALSAGKLSEEAQAWIEWARKKTDWYDPLTEASDDWLDETDRAKVKDIEQPHSNFSFFSNPLESIVAEKSKWPLLPWYLKSK